MILYNNNNYEYDNYVNIWIVRCNGHSVRETDTNNKCYLIIN